VDAYRVSGAEELRDAGLDAHDAASPQHAVMAVEWPERVAGAMPARHVQVHLSVAGENERDIVVTDSHGTLAERLAAAIGPKACPSCQAAAETFGPDWPFCSPRCRAADLGRWFGGHYQISRPIEQTDLEAGLD
jgi:endogenous inhibitor of DNA gyrase (YacG/DUF329 family)